jgi:D-sedoheptulose 7-phosphate isomerase
MKAKPSRLPSEGDQRLLTAICDSLVDQIRNLSLDRVLSASVVIARSARSGGRMFVAGNGGSAATASHFAADLMNRGSRLAGRRIQASCFNDNSSLVTALTNDIGWEAIYEYQLRSMARPGDVFLAISVNGGVLCENGLKQSRNLTRALTAARSLGCDTVGVAGDNGGSFEELCTVCIPISSKDPSIVEPIGSVVTHLLVESVASLLTGDTARTEATATSRNLEVGPSRI